MWGYLHYHTQLLGYQCSAQLWVVQFCWTITPSLSKAAANICVSADPDIHNWYTLIHKQFQSSENPSDEYDCQKTTLNTRICLSQSNTGESGNFQGSEQLSSTQSLEQQNEQSKHYFQEWPFSFVSWDTTLNSTKWLWHLPEQCDGHC